VCGVQNAGLPNGFGVLRKAQRKSFPCKSSFFHDLHLFRAAQPPVAHGANPLRTRCDRGVVGDQQDGFPLLVELPEDFHNLPARAAVQVAGRLVRLQNKGTGKGGGGPGIPGAFSTRCCCPPDIWLGRWFIRFLRPTRSSASAASSRRSGRDIPR